MMRHARRVLGVVLGIWSTGTRFAACAPAVSPICKENNKDISKSLSRSRVVSNDRTVCTILRRAALQNEVLRYVHMWLNSTRTFILAEVEVQRPRCGKTDPSCQSAWHPSMKISFDVPVAIRQGNLDEFDPCSDRFWLHEHVGLSSSDGTDPFLPSW